MTSFRHFFGTNPGFSSLSLLFALYLSVFVLNHIWTNSLLSFLQASGGLFFLVLGTGINLVLILQWIVKRKFDFWEFLSLSLLLSLLFPPLLLSIEFSFLKSVDFWYPTLNALLIWILAGILLFFQKTEFPSCPEEKLSIRHPLTLVLLFGLLFIAVQVLSYQTLPDLDPYKWLFKYKYQFDNHLLDWYERPLFGSFVYRATALSGLSIFTFFKYVLPFLFLSVLPPAWMVARTFSEKNKQWLFLLFAFVTPNTLLYAETAMPQAPFILIAYFFTLFLLYSINKKDSFFFYAAGATMLLAFFYHQTAIIFFLAWAILALLSNWKHLFSDKKIFLLVAVILASNLQRFQGIYDFLYHWILDIGIHFVTKSTLNLLYPAQYSNVDHNAMGWGSLSGVIKFYSFYVGPLLGLVLIFFAYFLTQKKFRTTLVGQFKKTPALSVLFLSFLFFFIIAEIFPRFPGLSLLPDRSWIFCGILSYVFLYLLLRYVRRISPTVVGIYLLSFSLVIFGTLYINSLKRYLISPMQLESAKWIQTNLPANRLFLSYGYKSLLPVHADTPIVKIPAALYCATDLQAYNDVFENFNTRRNTRLKEAFLENTYRPFLSEEQGVITNSLRDLDNSELFTDQKYAEALKDKKLLTQRLEKISEPALTEGIIIIHPLSLSPKLSAAILNENIYRFSNILLPDLQKRTLYIYYSQVHRKNPYRDRPYDMDSWGIEPCTEGEFLFDRYPENFQRVYNQKDADDEVIIWKIISDPLENSR